MNRGITRFIPIIFIGLIVVLVIAAIVSVVRMVIGNNDQSTSQVLDTSNQALLATDSNRSVRMTARGKIVGNETFRSYRVAVRPDQRTFARYKGYLEQPIVAKKYDNNTKAYEEFVYALSRAGLAKGTVLTGEANDTRGICANGIVYEFEIINGSKVIKRLWTSTCPEAKGSLVADVGLLQQLFVSQIPDAAEYIGKD